MKIPVALSVLVFLVGELAVSTGPGRAQEAEMSRCDQLAAHPDDPAAIAEGTDDGSIDTVSAIPACEEALSSDERNPRLQFQLGRSYWEADQDADAIDLFRDAAIGGDYAAAYAFLGIAYEYGYVTGDPETEIARSLYMIAVDKGFSRASGLLDSLAPNHPMNHDESTAAVEFSEYYQPSLLQNIYDRKFNNLNDESLKVVLYLRGMYEFFKQEVNWFDLRCAHLHDTRLVQKVIRNLMGAEGRNASPNAEAIVSQIMTAVQEKLQSGDIAGLITGAMEMQILQDEGKRDAGRLVTDNDNNCEAQTIKTLYKNAQYFFLREMTFR